MTSEQKYDFTAHSPVETGSFETQSTPSFFLVQIPGETLASWQTTGAFSAVETLFSYPQGELFEQNSDFSNSAQGYGPLCDLCASSDLPAAGRSGR
jgi:hypothetical protein